MMMGSPLWLLPVVLTTTASRPYVGTWQLNDSYTAPPYDRRLFSFVPGFHEGHMQRDVKCRDDNSWRWQWRPAGDAAPLSMMGAAELCATLGGVRVLSLGDSLSHQLVETFRVRRLERDFAVPASFGKSDTSGGKSDGKSAATSDGTSGGKGDGRRAANDPVARPTGDAGERTKNDPGAGSKNDPGGSERRDAGRSRSDARRNGGTFVLGRSGGRRAAGAGARDGLRQAGDQTHQSRHARRLRNAEVFDARVANATRCPAGQPGAGSTFEFTEPQRPWSLVPHEFRSSVAAFEPCVDAFKRKPGNFGVNHADIDELFDTVAAHMDPGTARRAVLYNCFAHLDEVARDLAACYSAEAPDRGAVALSVARRDVLVWWRRELAEMAVALRRVSLKAAALLGMDVRVFYRTSPPASDRWVWSSRYAKAHDLEAPEAPWAKPGGGCGAPLPDAAAVYDPPPGADEYGHEAFDLINAAAVAAFDAAGHSVVDVATMLGQRVDAHPASRDGGSSDALHFCIPGPLDYVLDLVLRRVRDEFERPRRDAAASADFELSGGTLKALLASPGREQTQVVAISKLLAAKREKKREGGE